MSEETTVVAFIDKLKPIQLQFIVVCLKAYGGKKYEDFNPGLVPFVSIKEVDRVLRVKLHEHRYAGNHVIGNKFILTLINLFGVRHEPEMVSFRLQLDTKKLIGKLRLREQHNQFRCEMPPDLRERHYSFEMIIFKKAKGNFWVIKCAPEYHSKLSLWLVDNCR